MKDILDLIKSRRTVKEFDLKPVSWENVARIIDAARFAPSSGNIQNWKFVVVMDGPAKTDIAGVCYDQYEISSAAALIVVCNEVEKAQRYYGLRGERLFSIQNCAAAIQNMLLEAHSLGLASCWIGAFDEDELRDLVGIPAEVRPQAIIAIGYSNKIPKAPPKYSLEMVTYLESWGNKVKDSASYGHEYSEILSRKAGTVKDQVSGGMSKGIDKGKELLAGLKKKSEEESDDSKKDEEL